VFSGDSPRRRCASKAKYVLDNTYEVQCVIMPGAGLITIPKTAKEDTKKFDK
jgi:hypothetical protein